MLEPLNKQVNTRFMAIKRSLHTSGVAGTMMLAFAFLALQSFAKPAHSMPVSGAFIPPAHQNFVTDKQDLLIPVAVFGKDQRKRLPRRYKKLDRQIGLLHNPRTNTLCTAFCVGPDMIATASHCLYSHRRRNRLYLSSFLFKLKTGKKMPVYIPNLRGTARAKQEDIL